MNGIIRSHEIMSNASCRINITIIDKCLFFRVIGCISSMYADLCISVRWRELTLSLRQNRFYDNFILFYFLFI